ncbi:MAG: alcohol dehydrogenase catalytic domain-containing protein [Acidobacteriota bacterium]|nr:alcohol dehydrogenase catalytic domain-containing protein [Acidobacteriota bacterium]
MRGAVYYGVDDVRLEDIEEPIPGPGQVKIKVAFNGLCGTDLHEIFDAQRAVPASPHPLTGVQAPVVLGHEIAGTVTGVGAGVEGSMVGKLVAVEPILGCGSCAWCSSGHVNLCDRLAFHGLSTGGGGLAEYTVVPQSMLHVAPPGLTPQEVAVAEPLAVAWHAVERSGVAGGQTAAVLGAGAIGIGISLVLRSRGIKAVVVEPSPSRRRLVEGLGATVLDPSSGDAVDRLLELTSGAGVDVCFETSAAVASYEVAVSSTAKHGVVMLLASPRLPLPPVLGKALARELEIRTSYAYHGDFPAVLDALSRALIPLDGWVTTAGLSSLHQVLADMRAGSRAKVLIDPSY